MKVWSRLDKVVISTGVGSSLCSRFNTIWRPEVVDNTFPRYFDVGMPILFSAV